MSADLTIECGTREHTIALLVAGLGWVLIIPVSWTLTYNILKSVQTPIEVRRQRSGVSPMINFAIRKVSLGGGGGGR